MEKMKVKPIHNKYIIKSNGRLHHHIYCGNCGGLKQRVYYKDRYCRECGCEIDWSKPEVNYEK